jgi:hypothetical protein
MPKNKVNDLITDQEMAFARLVLSGAMTDRQAAEAAGLNPDSGAYTKAKPRVRAYMLEHRAAVQQQLVQQEADGRHRINLDREQVLDRLWEIANMGPEMTRGSITGQVKALSMIVAMENFIPDRHAVSSQKTTPTPPAKPQVNVSAPQQKNPPNLPETPRDPGSPAPPVPASRGAEQVPPSPGHTHSTFANRFVPSQPQPPSPYVPIPNSVPDLRVPYSPKNNPFTHPR